MAAAAFFGLSLSGWHNVGCGVEDPYWDVPLEYPNRDLGNDYNPQDFSSANVCGGCHQTHYAEWSQSGMGRSGALSLFLIDLYRTSLDLRDAPSEDIAQCLHCHSPLAVMGDDPDLAMKQALSQEGVNCDVCHTAAAAHANDAPAMIEWDPKGPKRGPLPGKNDPASDVAPAVSPHHDTKYSALHESSELCGACHMSLWPTNALPIDWTYPEWKRSPYFERGVQCQDCHMPTYSGTAAPGAPKRDNLHSHAFHGGGNVELVRSAADISVHTEAHYAGHEIEVTVENTGAGHSFPTGNATAPVVELIVTAFNDKDEIVFTGKREYKLTYVDADGDVTNDPSAAVAMKSDTTLQPLDPKNERFYIAHAFGAVRAEAKLVYSRWSSDIVGSHRSKVVMEFVQRYLKQGVQLQRLPANLANLDLKNLERVSKMEPTVVDEKSFSLQPIPQRPAYLKR